MDTGNKERDLYSPLPSKAYLYVEVGAPFRAGSYIPIEDDRLRLGRITDDPRSIYFEDPRISRNHLEISRSDRDFFALDKKSKNGTTINGHTLDYFSARKLNHGDRIGLANGTVLLVFSIDHEELSTVSVPMQRTRFDLSLDTSRREAVIDGKTFAFRGNLYTIFALLCENPGKAVSHAEIKKAVWPDRARDIHGEPITSEEEIHLLIMRLRKKLAPYGHLVNNIRGYGYMLDLD